MVGIQHPHATQQRGHFNRCQPQQLGPIQQHLFGADDIVFLLPVAEAIGDRFQHLERGGIGHLLGGITAARCEGHADVKACRLGGLFHAQITCQNDHIGQAGAGFGSDRFQRGQHFLQARRLVAFPVFLRGQANAGAIGTAAQVRSTEGARAIPCGGNHLAAAEATGGDFCLYRIHIIASVARGHRILPDQVFGGGIGADVAHAWAHVAVGQLEPGAGKAIVEIGRICHEFFANRAIGRIHLHGHIGIGHDGHGALAGVRGINRHIFFFDIHRLPLPGTCGRFLQRPIIAKQQLEIAHVPFCGFGRPGAFQPRCYRIGCFATQIRVHPAQALVFDLGAFGFGPQRSGIAIAMGLAHGVAATGKRCGFFIVHRHARKGFAHLLGGFQRVGFAVHTLGVHIDQAHLHSRQRVFHGVGLGHVFIARVRGRQPFALGPPIGVFFGVPDIFAPERKAIGFQPHVFISHGACQQNQVCPRDLVAVFLFQRPQQAAGFV